MAGQRLSLDGFTEISAVCTHPEVRGRGLASALTYEVATKVLERGDRPFLHVAESNEAARRIYERLGFAQRQLVDFVAVKRTTEEA
jgi:predicted GNAT family acetyltransferase